MPSPSLVIRRVVVDGALSLNLTLDRGLNIIQAVPTNDDPKSSHKCGKTALVELIQHGLGRRQASREKFHFAPIIDEIKTLWLEIEANGEIITIERSLQEITARARVREGEYMRGIEAVPSELVPVEELSSVLLQALDIPRVSVKTSAGELAPLTFPTLMRAFILHQEDSFGAILDKMLPEQRRADVIGFLSRITPIERFIIEDKLAEVQQEVQAVESYFRSVQEFLYKNAVPTLLEAKSRVDIAMEALLAANELQRSLQMRIREDTHKQESETQPGRIDILHAQLFEVKAQVRVVEQHLIGLRKEEERLTEVLTSLEDDRKKAQRLRSSTTILSSVEFGICPRCLLEITDEMRQREQHARCSLCNRPMRTTSDMPPRATPKLDDIDLQINEAASVLKDVRKEIEVLQRELGRFQIKEAEIGQLIDKESQAYVSPAVDSLLARAHEVAQREADFAKAQSLLDQAQALEAIREQLNALKVEQTRLEDQLRESRKPNKQRLNEFRQIYERILMEIDFPEFRDCSIDSQTLMPSINGDLYIHYGSALKGLATVAYHFAMLELARAHETFFPRMLVIDSPAVGDLNDDSHDKLLRYFARLATKASGIENQEEGDEPNEPDWQVILTTRRLIPELATYVRKTISLPDQMLLRRKYS
ncbi:MAG: hypothetical protein L0226_08950 [Acidobacteria bacterium]|nr:hypothetical protein [Acidobacteriota bacterium]